MFKTYLSDIIEDAPLAQLDRATASKQWAASSNLAGSVIFYIKLFNFLMNNFLKIRNIQFRLFFDKYLNNFGLKIFQSGVLLLAAAPFISFILFLISSLIGSTKRSDAFFKDKYNLYFVVASILMIANSFLIKNKFIEIPELDT